MKSRVRIYTLEEQIQEACRISVDDHRRSERIGSWIGSWIEMACIILISAVLIPMLIAGGVLMSAVMIGLVHGAMAIVAVCPWVVLFVIVAVMVPERTEPNRR